MKTTAEKAKKRASFPGFMTGMKRMKRPKSKASKILELGPANATFSWSYFPLRLKGFTGTGLAPPIIKFVGRITITTGSKMVKKGSI